MARARRTFGLLTSTHPGYIFIKIVMMFIMLIILKRRSPTFENPQDNVLQVRPLPGAGAWVESACQAHSVHSLCPCWQGASLVIFLSWKFMHTDKMIVLVCTRIDWLDGRKNDSKIISGGLHCGAESLPPNGSVWLSNHQNVSKRQQRFLHFLIWCIFWWDRCRRQSLPAVSWEQKRRNLPACLVTGN